MKWASTNCAWRARDSVFDLTIEFPHGQAPTIALINGRAVELHVTDAAGPGADIPGIATAQIDESSLGFEAPSLVVAIRTAHPGTNVTAWTLPDNEVAVQSWTEAAGNASRPSCRDGWGSGRARSSPSSTFPTARMRPLKAEPCSPPACAKAPQDQLEGIMAHALTHAWMQSPRAWLSEGVAHFMALCGSKSSRAAPKH